MAIDVHSKAFVDPHGGIRDLAAKVLRTPTAPEISFSDDPLRMMRACRFAAQLGFKVDPVTFNAMKAMHERIEIVSPERVRDELSSCCWPTRRARASTCWWPADWPTSCCPSCPRCAWNATSTSATRTSTSTR